MNHRAVLLALATNLVGCAASPIGPPTGAQTFATHCASCHGVRGAGDGPVAAALAVPVPNLQLLSRHNGGEFPADAVASYIDGRNQPASHGERTMPVWGRIFDTTADIVVDAEPASLRIDALLGFLREIQADD